MIGTAQVVLRLRLQQDPLRRFHIFLSALMVSPAGAVGEPGIPGEVGLLEALARLPGALYADVVLRISVWARFRHPRGNPLEMRDNVAFQDAVERIVIHAKING